MNKKNFLIIITMLILLTACGENKQLKIKNKEDIMIEQGEEISQEVKEEKIKIVDLDSDSRPYAVIINNFPSAVKVQTGLNDSYLVYEFPVEGGMTRSLALFKDKETAKIGTVRSARHNFLDYVMENDAIFVHFGWSFYAEEQVSSLEINNINGLVDAPFWRENPEKLATEHTAYTSLVECRETAEKRGYSLTTNTKVPLKYTTEEVDLSNNILSENVNIVYSNVYKLRFKYDEENKNYIRYVNDKKHTDYFTKQDYTAKNIIILNINATYTESNYYLELNNVGTGSGYYITNGYAKKISWTKKNRKSQTIYKYEDGTEVKINDGNTYIMFVSNGQKFELN